MIDQSLAYSGPALRIVLVVDEQYIARFFRFLQQGVRIRCRVGCTVVDFLRDQLGADAATLDRIQSIMLDGKPVDDIGSALVHEGSVLALSAAMPGLVGATLRRGGTYAAFRSSITHHETGHARRPEEGWVGIKIFNLLMAELGPAVLRRGVLLRSADLLGFLAETDQDLREGCKHVTINGRPADIGSATESIALSGSDEVFHTVRSAADRA